MTTTVDDPARTSAAAEAGAPEAPPWASPARRVARVVRENWVLCALAGAAVAVSFLARWFIFPAYSYNRDEPVYLWMVEHLRAGQLTVTDGGHPEFFHPWLGAWRDGAFFSHFTIGWPAVLLASKVLFGTPGGAPALGAALLVLATFALARELTGDRSLALVAGGLMAASPILAVQGGVYLGYLFSAGLGLAFATAVVSGLRRQRPWLLVVGGGLLGCIFLTRPFDAVLWGLAVAGYVVVRHWGHWGRLIRVAAWLLPASVPMLVVALLFNAQVTGSPLEMPNAAADPLDKFGFGVRRMMPDLFGAPYGIGRAIESTLRNGWRVPLFLVGGHLGLLAAGAGLWLRRRDRTTLLLVAIIAVFPATYFFHWGMWVSSLVSRWGGPIYFVPLYGPLCILIATTLVAVWRHRRALGVALVAALVLAMLPPTVSRLAANRRLSQAQEPWRESVASIDGRALVFVQDSGAYLQFYNPFSANGPELDDRVLYATDRGAENIDLIGRMGDRTPYLQRAAIDDADLSVPADNPARFPPGELQPRERPPMPTIVLTELRLVEGRTVTLRLRVRNTERARVVRAFIDLGDGSGPAWRTLSDGAAGPAPETFDLEWTVAPASATSTGGSALPVLGREGTIALGAAFGTRGSPARDPDVRTLLHYRVSGSRVQVLLPGDQQVREKQDGRTAWFHDRRAVLDDRTAPPLLELSAS